MNWIRYLIRQNFVEQNISSDKIFRRTKVSTPSRNFDNFVRFLPYFCIEILDKIFDGKFFVGQKFRHQAEILTVLSNEFLSNKVYHFKMLDATILILDVFIFTAAITTYLYLYVTVQRIHKKSTVNKRSSDLRTIRLSKFRVPFLVLLTFVMFNITSTILLTVSSYIIGSGDLTILLISCDTSFCQHGGLRQKIKV